MVAVALPLEALEPALGSILLAAGASEEESSLPPDIADEGKVLGPSASPSLSSTANSAMVLLTQRMEAISCGSPGKGSRPQRVGIQSKGFSAKENNQGSLDCENPSRVPSKVTCGLVVSELEEKGRQELMRRPTQTSIAALQALDDLATPTATTEDLRPSKAME